MLFRSSNRWNLARLKNAFTHSGIMIVPVKDDDEGKDVVKRLKKENTGDMNQSKLLVVTKTRAQENEKAETIQLIEDKKSEEKGSWIDLHSMAKDDMVIAHRWFRSLTGIADNTGFDVQRIINDYEIALNTIIKPYQEEIGGWLSRIHEQVTGQPLEIGFENKPPFENDMFKFIWELRKERGWDYDETDPKQQEIWLK